MEVMDLQSTGKINMPGQPSPPSQSPDAAKPQTPTDAAATPKAQQNPQQAAAQMKAVNKDYLEYMRRLQANLAYLASIADKAHKPWNAIPQFPAILEPPPPLGEAEDGGEKAEKKSIRQLYGRLKELWPDYKTKGPSTTVG